MAVNDIHNQAASQGQTPFLLTRTQQSDTGLCMKGCIRTKEKCPRCGGKFGGTPLHCPTCLTTPQKYCIDIYEKVRLRIYSDKQGHPLDSYEKANRVLTTIRYEIDQHIFDYTKYRKEDLKNFLFENRIEAWLQDKLKEVEKENLASSYTNKLKCYIEQYYLPFFRGMDIREIRTRHVQEFYTQLPSRLSLKYMKNILNALENFFNTLVRFEYITHRPSFPVITVDRTAPKWIDLETQLKFLEGIPEGDRPIFEFLALQGVRPGEARALKVKDFNFKEGSFTVSRTYSNRRIRERVKGKVVTPRLINPALAPMLQELCKDKHPEAFVFISPRTGKPYSEDALFRIWDETRTTVGIDVTLYEATRHSVASIAASSGVSILAIKDVLNHSDVRTTLKYAHTNLESQKAVFQKKADVVSICPQTVPSGEQGKK